MKKVFFGISLVLCIVALSSCSIFIGLDPNAPAASITGKTETRAFELNEAFMALDASGGSYVTLIQADETSLNVTTDAGYFPRVKAVIENNVLHLGTVYAEDNIDVAVSFELRTDLKKLIALEAGGGSQISSDDISNIILTLDVGGGASINLPSITSDTIKLSSSGGGKINTTTLNTNTLNVDMSGGSSINIGSLNTSQLSIDGSGGAFLNVSSRCKATSSRLELSGGSQVTGCMF